jgi:hypothetical protein
MAQLDKEASQTRDFASQRSDPGSARFACSGQAASRGRKKRLLRMTIKPSH